MEPAPGRPELARDRVDERGQVVVRLLLDLSHAAGVGTVAVERISCAASAGTTPVSAHPSSAASSTSSQRSSLPSSDQILAISGRE